MAGAQYKFIPIHNLRDKYRLHDLVSGCFVLASGNCTRAEASILSNQRSGYGQIGTTIRVERLNYGTLLTLIYLSMLSWHG